MSILVGLSLLSMASLKTEKRIALATYRSFTDTGPAEGFSDGTNFSLLFVRVQSQRISILGVAPSFQLQQQLQEHGLWSQ